MKVPEEKAKADARRKNIGQRIRNLLNEAHESQSKLADDLKIDRSAVNQWVRGTTMPSTDNLKKVADHFGVSFESIYDWEPAPPKMVASAQAMLDELKRHL